MPPSEYLRRDAAAAFLGLSKSTLANWASQGRGPTFHKAGRVPLYAVAELHRFLAANTVAPLS